MDAIHQLDATPRRVVATYDSYEDAQAHVNRLSDLGFPVDHVVIVGTEPVLVERVTGLGYAFSSRRSFTSEATITASHYAVMVEEPLADEARRLMNRVTQTPVTN